MAFVLEGSFLALAGGGLGCLLSFLANGLSTSSTTASMSEIVFAFRVTPIDLGYGLLFAATMGVIGSLLPAFRAARLAIVSALREA
jgi:ABC-type antimicrobial peptide transport system permease subunit